MSEMVVLLLLAALLGLLVGWIIWGRRVRVETRTVVDHDAENRLRDQLKDCQEGQQARDQHIADLEGALAAANAAAAAAPAEDDGAVDYDGDGVIEGTDEGSKPATLSAARDGQADDLKMIKGVGPALEQLCNRLGFFHFDQIAAWTPEEVAWVDANLEGFKGRVSRDDWVEQARILAEGGETEFSKRVQDGGVY
ncbi:MAG: hypothetical protein CSA73_00340 [Rhodobacterales bacterium]|nr:MAG: hypothetical protein CSA73_00340 [Rhodobacterales bacterium]